MSTESNWCAGVRALIANTRARLSRPGSSLQDEYENLQHIGPAPGQPDLQHAAMVKQKLCREASRHPHLNRYSNVYPYDANLVPLQPQIDGAPMAYINATRIRLGCGDEQYIVTPAPMHPDYHGPDTTGDFWQLVWQENVQVIVNLARVQPGFSGSSQYWPTKVSHAGCEDLKYGSVTVRMRSDISSCPGVSVREFDISHHECMANHQDYPSGTRRVTQVHFTNWPNYGVPDDPAEFSSFVRQVREVESRARKKHLDSSSTSDGRNITNPILVHCSGGVGRSGTFVAVHHTWSALLGMQAATLPTELNLEPLVGELRAKRHPWMVEGLHQYTFCYQALFDLLQV
mmetsp:Transcript_23586/g.44922  ORF Transcript_23586/g.44922 Transcript_23586/m.44922 type:complete len:344 (-) Transcript_23586:392-1423(-)